MSSAQGSHSARASRRVEGGAVAMTQFACVVGSSRQSSPQDGQSALHSSLHVLGRRFVQVQASTRANAVDPVVVSALYRGCTASGHPVWAGS